MKVLLFQKLSLTGIYERIFPKREILRKQVKNCLVCRIDVKTMLLLFFEKPKYRKL